MTKYLKSLFIVLFAMAALVGCQSDEKDQPTPKANVYTELAKHSDLSIAMQAIDMAGLQSTFTKDNLTFFAPTDSAFSKHFENLGVNNLTELYNFYGAETFKNVILYHLLEKKVKGMDVINSYIVTAAKNSNGNHMHAYISSIDKNISLNAFAANVTKRDIEVDGSVIHKVDGVLSPLTLNGLIRVNPNFSKLRSAISKTQDNLEAILNQENQKYTIFGADDAAMNAFLSSKGFTGWSDFTSANSTYDLSCLLKYHILGGETKAADLQNKSYNTLYSGHEVEVVKKESGTLNILDEKGTFPVAGVKTTDIIAINGAIHIIDKVLEYN